MAALGLDNLFTQSENTKMELGNDFNLSCAPTRRGSEENEQYQFDKVNISGDGKLPIWTLLEQFFTSTKVVTHHYRHKN